MKLWRMICSNPLLASVDLILLLNKIDILDAQLKAGVQFSNYVTSYKKDLPNETAAVSRCTCPFPIHEFVTFNSALNQPRSFGNVYKST